MDGMGCRESRGGGAPPEVVLKSNLPSDKSSLSQLLSISDLRASFSLKRSLSLMLVVLTRSTSELRVLKPFSLLATSLMELMRLLRVGPMRSDSRSDRSEMGCRLQLSFLLLSSFSMMLRRRSLNLRRVQISVQCWALSSFWRSISQRIAQMALRKSQFSFFMDSILQQITQNQPEPPLFNKTLYLPPTLLLYNHPFSRPTSPSQKAGKKIDNQFLHFSIDYISKTTTLEPFTHSPYSQTTSLNSTPTNPTHHPIIPNYNFPSPLLPPFSKSLNLRGCQPKNKVGMEWVEGCVMCFGAERK